MRNCCLGSEFQRPVGLLLVVAAIYRLSVTLFVTELATDLAVVPELRGVLQLPELHARYTTAAQGRSLKVV